MADRKVDALRREAEQRAKAASRKIARLKSKGVVITGTEFDPRRDPKNVRRYTVNQADAYIRQLNQFIDRANQYVGSSGGQPIPIADARRFQETQRRFNEFVGQYRESFKDLQVEPLNNATVEDLNKRASGDWKTFAKGRSAQRPLAESESDIADINGLDKLRKLEKNMRDRMKGEYLNERIEQGREQAGQMLDAVGASEVRDEIAKLDDFQFNVLWHEMDLADSLASAYWVVKNASVRNAAAMQEEAIDDVKALISWGQTISPQR